MAYARILPPRRSYVAFARLPIDDVPQRVAGFGASAPFSISLVPTADGKGVTTGGLVPASPPRPGMSLLQISPSVLAALQAQASAQGTSPTAQLLVAPPPSLPAPPTPVYAVPGATPSASGDGKTALVVGAVLLVVVVGAFVATRKKG
jgi:hypothetical protein